MVMMMASPGSAAQDTARDQAIGARPASPDDDGPTRMCACTKLQH
jgi:hypothetical protein